MASVKNSLARKTRGKPGLEKTGSPARVSPWKYLYLHPRFSRRSTLVPMTTRLGWETTASRKEKRRDLCSSAEEHLCFRARARHNGVLRNAVEKRGKKKKKEKTFALFRAEVNNDIKRGKRWLTSCIDALLCEHVARVVGPTERSKDNLDDISIRDANSTLRTLIDWYINNTRYRIQCWLDSWGKFIVVDATPRIHNLSLHFIFNVIKL